MKESLLFLAKSFVFSIVFFCTVFGLYAVSSMNAAKKQSPEKTEAIDVQEYNNQIKESAVMMDRQKDLMRRAEANMAEQERNTKRMSAFLDYIERLSRKGN